MADELKVERATDADKASATLVASFVSDPVMRWIFDKPQAYLTGFPRFAAALHGPAYDHDMTFQVDDHAGVAIWLPPGVEGDSDGVLAAVQEKVAPEKLPEMFEIATQVGEAHPDYPHWYLAWLAVDPARQNEGLGARLMKHALKIVDESGLPAWLESPNPRNIPFYERHGFEIVGRTETATAPPVHWMLRPGRG